MDTVSPDAHLNTLSRVIVNVTNVVWTNEQDGSGPRRRSDVSFLERKFKSLALRRNASDTSVEIVGDLGLNLLHEPSECLIDFIFVHGLRGGSRKTWSASASQAHFWPKEWLPADSDFRHVRIHSFGYNSDWLDRRENPLNVHDFGQSLIEEIQNSPNIRRDKNTRIVFVGHSMGGLVIKKVCILSRENPSFNELGTRIHSIYFLATPHRGSDLAQTLQNLLRATSSGNKSFVSNLERGSETINILNDQFRHVCKDIAIHSFTESVPTNWHIGSGLVVDQQSATLGYPDERVQALNADHRNMCKFDSPNDTNFRTLRNRLASTVEEIERSASKSRRQTLREEMQALSRYLNVSGPPIDELSSLEDARLPGSCEWLSSKKTFLDWQFNDESQRYFWLTGQPATGKSVITAHVIECLDENSSSYYFFGHRDHNRSSLSTLLLSIAYQMAQKSRAIREKLLELSQDDSLLDKDDYRGIWRRLFIGGIFRTDFAHTHYWVIDALDECAIAEKRSFENFFSILAKIDSSIPLKVFISSRASADLERLFSTLPFLNVHISPDDSTEDIRMFVETYAEDLPAENEQARQALVETIVRKSAGCFLWTVLVMRQLQDIYTSLEIEEVLSEVPEEMEALYSRNLQIMATRTRTKKLAQAVLAWTLCATRSLTVEELKDAIRLDLKTVVTRDLERSISSLCGQFVFVDKYNRVQIVHETARTFLLDANLDSEFRVHISTGNLQLGLACLAYLASDEMAHPRKRRGLASVPREPPKNESALGSYACLSFSDHLVRSSSSSDPLFLALTKFLRTNILVWIERMAYEDNLGCLIRTAKHFKAYQARRAKHVAPLQDEISAWAADLPRLVTEFGRNLSKYPVAIHKLVPPLCPRTSSIYRQFGTANTGLQLRGLSNPDWDDRISSYYYRDRTARCITCQDQWYAVGLSDGVIHVYWTSTCQEAVLLHHGEPVRILRFGNLAKVLVSAGLRSIKIWDVSTGSQLLELKMKSDPLAVDFDDDDKRLVAATRSKEMFEWSTNDGSIVSHYSWHHSLPNDFRHIISRAPSIVAISTEHKLMAIVYRSMPLCLWDLEAHQPLGFCTKESDDGRDTSNNITSAVFNPVQVLNLLAVAYWHGDVAIFDTLSRTVKCHARIDTQTLAVSPDGRTLAGGDSSGQIKLFDFETLQPLYRVTLSSDGIAALAFTSDSLRLMDLRGAQANVWEPSALVRKWDYADDDRSEFSSDATAPVSEGPGMSPVDQLGDITTMTTAYTDTLAICGRNSGSIGIYDLGSTEPAFQELYKHKGAFMEILALNWNEAQEIVASVDVSSRFRVMRVSKGTSNLLTVLDELLDAQLGYGHLVSQILISPDGSSLLVSSATADFLWSLETKALVASRETESRRSWRWFTHPQNPTEVLLLEGSTLQSFSWGTSATFSKVAEARIVLGGHEILELGNMIVNTNGNNLVLKLLREGGPRGSLPLSNMKESSLYTVDLSGLGSGQQSILPLPLFPMQGIKNNPNVEILLGMVPGAFGGRRLIFISEMGWICSVDFDKTAPYESFQRHFFIPFAWLSTRATVISMVTVRKDILFVRGHEVAIVKKGLETAEVMSIR